MMDQVHEPVISEEQHITYQNRLQKFYVHQQMHLFISLRKH